MTTSPPPSPAGGELPSPTAATVVRTVLAVIALTLVVAWVRAGVESHRYAGWGDASVASGDWESAVLHYRHALQWHAPLIGESRPAFDALVDLGDALEAEGNGDAALIAYRSARWGVMSIRHVRTPFAAELPALHAKIGALMAAQTGDATDAARFTAELDAYPSRRPNPWLSAGASLGFMAWIAALVFLAARGFDAEGNVRRAFAVRAAAGAIVAFLFWIACVRFA